MHVRKSIRLLAVCFLPVLPLVLGGCWSQINLDQLTVVSAIGLDAAEDDRVEVTVQLVNPTLPVAAGGGQQRKPFAIYSSKGLTIEDALKQIKQQAKKSVFLPQTRVVLIGEAMARRGLDGIMDFFWREPTHNMNSWVLISKTPARKALESSFELEAVPADEWKEYLNSKERRPSIEADMLYQFLPRLQQDGFHASAAGMFPVSGARGKQIMKIGNTAVFKREKMVGWLTLEESQTTNWLTRDSRKGSMRVDLPEQGEINFDLRNIRVRIDPAFRQDRASMKIRVQGDAEIVTTTALLNVADPKTVAMLEQRLNERIRASIEETIAKVCGTYKTDVFGFGESIHRKFPQKWKSLKKQWDEEVDKLDAQVSVSMNVFKSGMLRDGI
ncbi:Ger(x)C family spore germination protein [Paenibacillus sp. GYB003]|uniref:Ger(x)C family spore germination protein n=1 Tax=Paenibacillus sp. GYB003 TaxID=2994392 RepID=UPI002F966C8A